MIPFRIITYPIMAILFLLIYDIGIVSLLEKLFIENIAIGIIVSIIVILWAIITISDIIYRNSF